MDQRLLTYYNRELQYLRELGGEFAQSFPKIAGRLGLSSFECADPYVERLLEGFAFLAARVQLKIDAEFPRFTEHLFSMVYPHYLAPTPSMAVVRFEPNHRQGSLVDGVTVPRGTALHSQFGRSEQTTCEYRTGHEVRLWPLELTSVVHTTQLGDLGELRLPHRTTPRASLRFRFRVHGGARVSRLALDALPLFVTGPARLASDLYELLLGGALGLVVRGSMGEPGSLVTGEGVRSLGFDDAESLLPVTPRSFQGFRLLQEYFALPERYSFVELCGLSEGLKKIQGDSFEVVVLLDRHAPSIEAAIGASHFELFCSPIVNLFPKRADRIHLSNRSHQYHVVVDRTRPLDFELHSVTRVAGFGAGNEQRREFRPFYAMRDRDAADAEGAYYTVHRDARLASGRERKLGPRSSYSGSESYIALVNGLNGPFHSDLRQLSIEALCTNRDLPLMLPLGQAGSDFSVESGAPVVGVRCVAGPSEPRMPIAWDGTSWKLVKHLCAGQLSLLDQASDGGALGLRELLFLYSNGVNPSLRSQVEGLVALTTSPVVERLPGNGPARFGRGVEVTLHCDEAAFEGSSAFLLSAVLDRFFQRYIGINSFSRTVLRSSQRGVVTRWPLRIGRRVPA